MIKKLVFIKQYLLFFRNTIMLLIYKGTYIWLRHKTFSAKILGADFCADVAVETSRRGDGDRAGKRESGALGDRCNGITVPRSRFAGQWGRILRPPSLALQTQIRPVVYALSLSTGVGEDPPGHRLLSH